MACGPTPSVESVSMASTPDSGTLPSDVAPSKNSTLPVGATAPDSVAVKLTVSPGVEVGPPSVPRCFAKLRWGRYLDPQQFLQNVDLGETGN